MDADLAPLVKAVGEDEVVVAAQRACKHRLRNEKTGEGGKIFQHVASIAMSVVLARVNAFVSVETKNLLIGEAASNEMATGVRKRSCSAGTTNRCWLRHSNVRPATIIAEQGLRRFASLRVQR